MNDPLHIAIIGAGLIGLSCADALLARGVKVTLFEQRSGPVMGTSRSNSGMIHPSQSQSWAPDLPHDPSAAASVLSLARESQVLIAETMKRLGLSEMASRPHGCAQIFESAADLARAAELYDAAGIAYKEMTGTAHIFERPTLFFPDDRSGNARAYGQALERDVIRRGAHIIYNVNDIQLLRASGGVVIAVNSDNFRPDHVVIAAGPDTPKLLSQLGLTIGMIGVRGHALNFSKPGIALPDVPVMDAQSRTALSVFGDILRLSGGWHNDSAAPILERWAEIAPNLIAALDPPQETWTAMRPVSTVGRPYICEAPIAGLWVNAGHGHMGWTLCAGSGALMAAAILDGSVHLQFAYRA